MFNIAAGLYTRRAWVFAVCAQHSGRRTTGRDIDTPGAHQKGHGKQEARATVEPILMSTITAKETVYSHP
jgi:hypothetical protein